jgi:type II secretory pathway component PulJ
MIKGPLLKSRKGASLIELILYFALLGIVLVIATDIILRTSEFSLETSSRNNLQDDARFVISRLSYDIRRADSISNPANLGDNSSTLMLAVGSETHTYNLLGTNLEYQKETGPPTVIQTSNVNSSYTKVNSLNFERLGNSSGKHTIKITFELEGTQAQKGGPVQKTFITLVGLR